MVPAEIQPFKAYGTAVACVTDGAGVTFRAALGNIEKGTKEERALTFFVYLWSEKPDGALTLIPIPDPPKNAPSFFVRDGKLILTGVTAGVIVEREVPGYVARPDPPTAGQVLGVLIQQLAKEDTGVTEAVRDAVGRALMGK